MVGKQIRVRRKLRMTKCEISSLPDNELVHLRRRKLVVLPHPIEHSRCYRLSHMSFCHDGSETLKQGTAPSCISRVLVKVQCSGRPSGLRMDHFRSFQQVVLLWKNHFCQGASWQLLQILSLNPPARLRTGFKGRLTPDKKTRQGAGGFMFVLWTTWEMFLQFLWWKNVKWERKIHLYGKFSTETGRLDDTFQLLVTIVLHHLNLNWDSTFHCPG